jgi:DNA-binding NtrC family response regulator
VLRSAKIEIAVYGQSLLSNSQLMSRLNKKFRVFQCENLIQLQSVMENHSIKILLIEIGSNGKELKTLKVIHSSSPSVRVIALGDEEPKEHLIKAYKYGSKDFFKLPVNTALLIERVESIIKINTQQLITI